MAGPPDPSQPDRQKEMIREEIVSFFRDPMLIPEEFTTWLTTYISLNVGTTGVTIPDDHITKPAGP